MSMRTSLSSAEKCFDRLVVSTMVREDDKNGDYAHHIFVILQLSFLLLMLEKGQ